MSLFAGVVTLGLPIGVLGIHRGVWVSRVPCYWPGISYCGRALMAGPVPMLACVGSRTHTHSSDINPSLPDWAVYEALKTTFIPGYSAYPVQSNPAPLEPSITGIAPENESQVRLAGRYAMCSAAGMSTAAVITNPLEVVRTRWQTSGGYMTVSTPHGDMTKKATLPGLIQQIWKQAGWKGFMRGAGMRVLYYVGSLRYRVSSLRD